MSADIVGQVYELDDLLATGVTMKEACDLVEKLKDYDVCYLKKFEEE